MSIKPEILDAMVASGCTAEQIAAVVKAASAKVSTNAERQRRYRERHRNVSNVTERNGDVTNVETPSPKKRKVSPCTPSKEKNNPIPSSSEAIASSEPAARDDEQLGFDAWNDTARRNDLPVAEKLTKDRRSKLTARIADAGGLDGWFRALDRLEASDFCTGRKTDFRANLDFVLQASSFLKLIEGSYDNNRNQRGQHEQRNAPAQRRSREDDINAGVSDVFAARRVREPAFQSDQGSEHGWPRDRFSSGDVTLERGEDGAFGAYPHHASGPGYGRH